MQKVHRPMGNFWFNFFNKYLPDANHWPGVSVLLALPPPVIFLLLNWPRDVPGIVLSPFQHDPFRSLLGSSKVEILASPSPAQCSKVTYP